jgi:hypothetical protein
VLRHHDDGVGHVNTSECARGRLSANQKASEATLPRPSVHASRVGDLGLEPGTSRM